MHCFYFGEERDCMGVCHSCPYGFNPFPTYQMSYQYKCPCGGEFLEPIYKFISDETKEIGTAEVVSNVHAGHYGFICPFCGQEMRGLLQ